LLLARKLLLSFGVGWVALGVIFPNALPNTPFPLAMAAIDLLLLWLAVVDLRTRHVSNALTYPLMAAGIARAALLADPSFLLFWGVLWLLWIARIYGAGDAKLLMGLFGLFPNMEMVWSLAMAVLATGIPYLVIKHRRILTNSQQLGTALRSIGWRIITGQWLPSQDKLDEEGVPFVFAFSLGGAAYLFVRVWHP
jgi:Flp pilus assembly protein protease CpaA